MPLPGIETLSFDDLGLRAFGYKIFTVEVYTLVVKSTIMERNWLNWNPGSAVLQLCNSWSNYLAFL